MTKCAIRMALWGLLTIVPGGHTLFAQQSSGLPAPGVYTGIVGTRTELANAVNASFTWAMDVSVSIARASIPANSMRVVWSNYYVTTSNVETSPGGTATIKYSIEYPIGTTPTSCTIGGSSSGTVAGLADLISDKCNPAIPNGAAFRVRTLYQNASGIMYTGSYSNNHFSTTLEGLGYGTGTATDYTAVTTVPSGGTGNIAYKPSAIIGTTSKPSVCMVGDSRVNGLADVANDFTLDTGELARSIGPMYGYTKLSVISTTVNAALSNFTNRLRLVAYCTHVIDNYGINDLNALGRTATQVAGDRTSFATLLGKPTFGTTLPPETSSTDSWATTTNQTVTQSTTAFNALVVAGISGESGYFDIDSVIDPTGINKWPIITGTSNYATADGVHETNVMNGIIKRSGIVSPTWLNQ